jgi:hypothetical protein
MPSLYEFPFRPLDTTAPSFNSTNADGIALQSTGVREWRFPSSRAVRITSKDSADFHIAFGSSTVIANTSACMAVLGGVSEIFTLQPHQTHIAIASSTDVTVNITPGTGF